MHINNFRIANKWDPGYPGFVITQKYREIVLKLDCEGAEYEILCSLREADVLRQIGIIMLEWHRRAGENMPQRIHDLLTAAGYVVFGDAIAGMECGMMRAVRV